MLNEVEKNTIGSEANRGRFNFARSEKIKTEKNRLDKFDKKNLQEKKIEVKISTWAGRRGLYSHILNKKERRSWKILQKQHRQQDLLP